MTLRRLLTAGILGLACSTSALAAERAIIVLDASGSMWGQIDGVAKIDIARKALSGVIDSLDANREIGLMAYGHREKGQCRDIELIVEPQVGFADRINQAVRRIRPRGKTPLSDSVRQAAEALKFTEDKATVILITDGLETCEADPCALGRQLEQLGVDFTAHVVGFGLSEEDGKKVSCLAEETGGIYLPAGDADELVDALDKTVVEPEPDPVQATLDAPDEATMASTVTVAFTGPGEKNDRIELWDPSARQGEGKRLSQVSLGLGFDDGETVEITLPAEEGAYELRYWHFESRKVLAMRPITALPVPVTLTAPEQTPIARHFTVGWDAPRGNNDQIQLWDPSARGGEGRKWHSRAVKNGDLDNQTVRLPAAPKPGMYELRYWNAQDRKVLATLPIEIVPMDVTLTVTGDAAVGKPLLIAWEGPGARYDQIELWDPNARGGEGKKISSQSVRNGDFDNQKVRLPGPGKAGTYELRYWNGDNRFVLATQELAIADTEVSLDAPDQIEAARTIRVTWEGPGARYDDVLLFDPNAKGGEGKIIARKRLRNDDFDNKRATLPAPAKPGQYELQYWNGDNRKVLASRPIEVIEAQVSLEAPDQIEAAKTIRIAWEGPGARYDDVQLFDPNAKGGQGQVIASKRLRNDDFDNNRASLTAPAKPGEYELRYWNGDNRSVMATRPIQVLPSIVALDAKAQIGQGQTLRVAWVGPGARYDDVQIFNPRTEKVVRSQRLNRGDYDNQNASLPAPTKPGQYLLRYWNGDNNAVMATRPLEVVAIPVSVIGPDAVEPETVFGVTWEGPGARYDDVQIFDPQSNRVVSSKRLTRDDYDNRKANIKAPKQPGEYLLRYWNGDYKTVLFEAPLSVN
ncbi:MAG: VWA domain-containing protein [Pseudomonadota bacterium]